MDTLKQGMGQEKLTGKYRLYAYISTTCDRIFDRIMVIYGDVKYSLIQRSDISITETSTEITIAIPATDWRREIYHIVFLIFLAIMFVLPITLTWASFLVTLPPAFLAFSPLGFGGVAYFLYLKYVLVGCEEITISRIEHKVIHSMRIMEKFSWLPPIIFRKESSIGQVRVELIPRRNVFGNKILFHSLKLRLGGKNIWVAVKRSEEDKERIFHLVQKYLYSLGS